MLTCPNCGEKVSSPSDLTARLATCRCGAEFPIAAEATMLPQAPAPQTSSPVPEIDVPGYQILNPIGSGGMGTVYQAVQQSLGRKVAIKVLPKDLASDPHFVSRFEREAAALAQLSHPNIVNIIDRGQAGAIFYFVMELIEARSGGPSSLRELIDKGLLAPEQVTGYACQIAGALTAAHAKGIIHRDIKPSNVLVDETGNARVVDFGIAQLIQGGPDAQPQLTLAGSAIGTPRYMSPEQRQDGSSADARSDIYSLGFVLYEMLTGLIPEGVFELPSELGHDPAWDEIIEKAIRRNPDLRYSSMQEFLRALEALRSTASDLTVTSAPAPLEGTSGGTYSTPPEDSCHDCNHPNPPENRFCASCGVNLFEPCPVCAGDNRLGLSFCGSCGGNLSDL
ncbi:MAG: protein kinase, partial [Candidatus Binatia bacterium]|nr:protein kinase [Candidatus Binatia bacterium]